ncbi:GspH/FimT family pseudopilin [Pseudofrancisella aestuarii]|uniref:Type II secretion system protein H n=1 Tax=Pseudofrancisella aestuarii TaxID=2670347 RepID=A0ABV9TBR0_9GAMM|nr:GspH/FimT family pseudopilin [Pseudofrancisella aestuarii]
MFCVKRNKGFSLVEVMVVIVIMTILMMGAISSFSFYQRNFAETRLTSLQNIIGYGQVVARSQRTSVVICPVTSDSYIGATDELNEDSLRCSGSSNWGNAEIVAFTNQSANGVFDKNNDEIISTLPTGKGNISTTFNTDFILISPVGFLNTTNASIIYCLNGDYLAALQVNMVGRVVYTTDNNNFNCN